MFAKYGWFPVPQTLTFLAPDGAGGGSGDPAPADPKADPKPTDPPKPEGEKKTFTQEDIDAVISRVTAKQKADAERREKEALERGKAEGKTEAEKLAKMSEQQRADELARQAIEAVEKREKEIAVREEAVKKRELRAQAIETLRTKGLGEGLADFLDYANAEACNASIEKLEKSYRAAVQASVEDRLKSAGVPIVRDKGDVNLDAMTDDQYYAYQAAQKKPKG